MGNDPSQILTLFVIGKKLFPVGVQVVKNNWLDRLETLEMKWFHGWMEDELRNDFQILDSMDFLFLSVWAKLRK